MAQFQWIEWLLHWLLETQIFQFEWDEANREKSLKKHSVSADETEDLFRSKMALPLGVQVSPHVNEERLAVVGPSKEGKLIFVVFTMRNGKIRPISARRAHWKERISYEEILRKISQRI